MKACGICASDVHSIAGMFCATTFRLDQKSPLTAHDGTPREPLGSTVMKGKRLT